MTFFCRSPHLPVPEEIFVLDEMPLNATGKVHRLLLKEMAAKEHAHGAEGA